VVFFWRGDEAGRQTRQVLRCWSDAGQVISDFCYKVEFVQEEQRTSARRRLPACLPRFLLKLFRLGTDGIRTRQDLGGPKEAWPGQGLPSWSLTSVYFIPHLKNNNLKSRGIYKSEPSLGKGSTSRERTSRLLPSRRPKGPTQISQESQSGNNKQSKWSGNSLFSADRFNHPSF